MPPLERKDRIIIGLLVFFIVVVWTVELYWGVLYDQMVARAPNEFLADLYRIYGDADRSYSDRPEAAACTRGLESFNVFFTQPLNAWLIWAILRRKPYRHALQLALGAYLSYSVLFYFWTAWLSGFQQMPARTAYAYFLFFTPNLPWLFAYLFMAWDSARAINCQMHKAPSCEASP